MRKFLFDIETFKFRRGLKIPKPVAIGITEDGQKCDIYSCVYDLPEALERIHAALVDESCIIINQNIAFDLAVLMNEYPRMKTAIKKALDDGRISDTMLRAKLIRIAMGTFVWDTDSNGKTIKPKFGLDTLAEEALGVDISDAKEGDTRKGYSKLYHLPVDQWPKDAIDYLEGDLRITWGVWHSQNADLLRQPCAADGSQIAFEEGDDVVRVRCEDDTIADQFTLECMSAWGLWRDEEHIRWLRKSIENELAVKEAKIKALCKAEGTDPCIRDNGSKDTKAIKARLKAYYIRSGNAPALAPKGEELRSNGVTDLDTLEPFFSTSSEVLENTDDEVLTILASRGSTATELSKDIPLLEMGAGYPLTYSARTPLITGRVATVNPNVQNFARKPGVREAFVARPGYLLCSVDYDTLEVRSWGKACKELLGYSTVFDNYVEDPNWDPHSYFGALIINASYDEFKAILKDKAHPRYKEVKNARQMAKAFVFGRPGGMGDERLQASAKNYGIILSLEECSRLKNLWHEVFPEGWDFFGYISEVTNTHKTIALDWVGGLVKGGSDFCDACNFTFQGPAAAGAKKACNALFWETHNPDSVMYGAHLIVPAHDEIIAEVPIERAHECAMFMVDVMQREMQSLLELPIRATPALMDRWYKSAEDVWVDGKLVQWEPPADYWKEREQYA